MRVVRTLLKVIIGLAIAIPLAIVVFAATLGVLGAMIGIAVVALKLAIFALIGLGVFRLATRLFGSKPERSEPVARRLPPADPYYDAAMRELSAELGERPRG